MKKVSLYAMIALYIAAGINHFVNKDLYLGIMPPWIPWHNTLVLLSGILEILFALLLIFPSTRKIGAWCIIGLLIAVFPANIQTMINYWDGPYLKLFIAILRLPLQIVLIRWAYKFAKPRHHYHT